MPPMTCIGLKEVIILSPFSAIIRNLLMRKVLMTTVIVTKVVAPRNGSLVGWIGAEVMKQL